MEVTFSLQLPGPLPAPTKARMGEGPTADDFVLHLCLFGPDEGEVRHWIPARLETPQTDGRGFITGGEFKVLLPLSDEKRTIHLIANPPGEVTPTTSDYLDNVMERMVTVRGTEEESG